MESSSLRSSSRKWEELPRDVMLTVIMKLTPREILEIMQFVCKSWCEACKDPAAWKKVEIIGKTDTMYANDWISFAAVKRSQGHLQEISLEYVRSNRLLLLMAERSSNLRSLRIRCCDDLSDGVLCEALRKLRLLEELEFTLCRFDAVMIRSIGQSCPNLLSFKLNEAGYEIPFPNNKEVADEKARAIAETMPRIHCLQLIGSVMTNKGLQAILDSCSSLKSLDIRACLQVDLSGDLGKKCAEKVKVVKWPRDSISDYRFDTIKPFYGCMGGCCDSDDSDDNIIIAPKKEENDDNIGIAPKKEERKDESDEEDEDLGWNLFD